jgi:hypothetical protein
MSPRRLLPPHSLAISTSSRLLLVLGEDVALFRGGEAALWRRRKLLQRGELCRLGEPAPALTMVTAISNSGANEVQPY